MPSFPNTQFQPNGKDEMKLPNTMSTATLTSIGTRIAGTLNPALSSPPSYNIHKLDKRIQVPCCINANYITIKISDHPIHENSAKKNSAYKILNPHTHAFSFTSYLALKKSYSTCHKAFSNNTLPNHAQSTSASKKAKQRGGWLT